MKFISRFKEHVIVFKHRINQVINGISVPISGDHIEFKNGEYATEDKDKIDFLKAKPYYGIDIWEEKGSKEIKAEAAEAIINATGISDTLSSRQRFICEVCGFEAKSKLGLTAHIKKH
jgi:hypothetical protein